MFTGKVMLLPDYIDEIDKLKQENQELKKENKILRKNAEHNDKVVDKVNWENLKLKKQLEEAQENYEKESYIVDKQTRQLTDEYKNTKYQANKVKELENHQKEFIKYMNKTIEELECDDVDDEELKGYLILAIDTYKEILSTYKKVIRYVDE